MREKGDEEERKEQQYKKMCDALAAASQEARKR